MIYGVMKKRSIDILNGNLWKNILIFSIPLILTNLLQILFNLSDLVVVGKFSPTSDPLGSVGSTTVFISLITSFIIGISNGVNSLVSTSIGAGNIERVKKQLTNSFFFMVISGIVISILCVVSARGILKLLETPDNLLDSAVNYLRIYSIGLVATSIFNFGNAVLSANGETKKPLLFLSIAGVANIGLNFLFVVGFHIYAEGVAIASTITQFLAAILVLICLFVRKDYLKLDFKGFKLYGNIQKDIMRLGLVSGLQNSIFYIANLFIQWQVNTFGDIMVKGNTAAMNLDNIIFDIMAAIYVAGCTFVAQNRGAKQFDRIKKSYYIMLVYSGGIALFLGLLFFFFKDFFLSLFTSDAEVIKAGEVRVNIMCLCNWLSCFMDGSIAANRGLGKTKIPTLFVIAGALVFRIIWIFALVSTIHDPYLLYAVYPISFVLTAIAETIYFFISYKKCSEGKEIEGWL